MDSPLQDIDKVISDKTLNRKEHEENQESFAIFACLVVNLG